MNKELEAFEKIFDRLIIVDGNTTRGSIIDYSNLMIIEKALKALEIIKETWGDSILSDIEKGFVFGSPYTELPNKEKIDLLKEVLL